MASGDPGSQMEKIGTVVARSLAFLCLQETDVNKGTLLQRARFLAGLGLPYGEAAGMLGTTKESLDALERQAKNAKGKKSGKEIKVKAKTKRGKRTR
jgi:hypothetical protein